MTNAEILTQNAAAWNAMADDWFGTTALPVYGCLCPTEDELRLFPELSGKKVLDIGCGSGHSLQWCGDHGAAELWGLDISEHQLANAGRHLRENGYAPKLFCSPMEQNLGLPEDYFDVAYSIYALGWAVELQTTLNLIARYLKPGGVFIFSWDHPFMHCVDVECRRQRAGYRHGDNPFQRGDCEWRCKLRVGIGLIFGRTPRIP